MSIRSIIRGAVARGLDRQGLMIVRPRLQFGFDPWQDIIHLAQIWHISIRLFVDVGANDGGTARTALKLFPDAKIISFEPHPATFATLQQHFGAHKRFEAINVALGKETGTVDFFEYDSSKIASMIDNARFAVRFGKKARKLHVECETLDKFCMRRGIKTVDVLKIDTEGCDHLVLQGAKTMLKEGAIKFLVIEFNDLFPKEGTTGGALSTISDLVCPQGYKFVASYNDYVETKGEMFSVSNALFALPL